MKLLRQPDDGFAEALADLARGSNLFDPEIETARRDDTALIELTERSTAPGSRRTGSPSARQSC